VSRRTSVSLGLVLAATALGVVGGSVPSSAEGSDVVPGSDPAAVAALARAVHAATSVGYSGVEVLTTSTATGGGSASVLDVGHIPGRGTVVTLHPGAGSSSAGTFTEDGPQAASTKAALLLQLLGRSYRLRTSAPQTVLGRPALVVSAEHVDGTPAATFWIDSRTGLLLRRVVLDDSGEPVSSVELVQLTLGSPRITSLPPMQPAPSQPALDSGDLGVARGNGWPCPTALAGFTLFDARWATGAGARPGGARVLHLTYSDGLSTLSLFVQDGRLDPSVLAATKAQQIGGRQVHVVPSIPGEARQLVLDAHGRVFTVVTDAPSDLVSAVVAQLPSGDDPDALGDRVHRGLSRMLAWANPFD
jgi:sigma-E factor negative regulatory protein RseB